MNVEIAERLAARRKEAGLSQEGLAEKLGVSRQAVSKWERSESSPDTDNLISLAKLYGVSLDDLLYVDGSIEEDVEFEAADRAASRESVEDVRARTEAMPSQTPDWTFSDAQTPGGIPSTETSSTPEAPGVGEGSAGSAPFSADSASTAGASPVDSGASFGNPDTVRIGFGGVHVREGDDYVHVSWRDGVHVRDSKKGDEVHVGWNGIHVNEGEKRRRDKRGGDDSWFAAGDDEGNTVGWTGDGVEINGEHFDTWQDARGHYGCDGWRKPNGYTVRGERFDTLDEARAKYGDEVGKSIPVRKHYKVNSWLKFPYPLVAIIAYLLIGFSSAEWGIGLFVFLTIPVYYMIGHAVQTGRIAHFLGGLYPLCAVAWFLYMAFVANAPHPAWVIFLTIPVVEWVVHAVSRWWRHRKKEANAIDVEADPKI